MPELPEVETIARSLQKSGVCGHDIRDVRIVLGPDLSSLKGDRFISIKRRGKYLVFSLSDRYLIVHLRMSGKFLVKNIDDPLEKHERVAFDLSSGLSLRFHDVRKFGTLDLVFEPDGILGRLGPEPFEIGEGYFSKALLQKKQALKGLLLDQHFLAGLGNIYVDEALWRSGLHPLRKACDLNGDEAKNLYNAVIYVLKRGIEAKGTSLGSSAANYQMVNGESGKHQGLLDVYGRGGKRCKRCKSAIVKIVVAQRGTHFCPTCQII